MDPSFYQTCHSRGWRLCARTCATSRSFKIQIPCGSKTGSQIPVKFIIFCVSKLKVKYSFLLVSWKYWVDFHVSKLKVKIRTSFMPTSSKTLNSYLICFESFTQFEGRQKSGRNFLMFFRLRKLKIHISWAIKRFWKINPWFSSFFGLL